jgi:hypothetical protein
MMLRTVYSDKAAEGVFCYGRSCFTGSIIGSTSWPISNVLAAALIFWHPICAHHESTALPPSLAVVVISK